MTRPEHSTPPVEPELVVDLRIEQTPDSTTSAAETDHLTGLHSRRWLDEALNLEIQQNPGSFSILFIDLDGLKAVNDRYGHAAGDRHIVSLAESLRATLRDGESRRPGDPVRPADDLAEGAVRLGGDEFVVLLRNVTNDEDLESIKRRIRQNFTADGVRASIGGRSHRPGETGSALLAAADALMYQDKRQRRDERLEAMPAYRRAAYQAGRLLIRYSGIDDPR